MSNIVIPKKSFQGFLDSLGKVSDSVILHVKKDRMYAIASSEDRSMFLWSSLEGDFNTECVLNLPSVKKLSKALNLTTGTDVSFTINTNNMEYKGNAVRFVYHLYGDGILVAPRITLSKIENLKFQNTFQVEKQFIQSLLKNSSVFKDTNKLYVYTDDDHLVWSLGDKTMVNTDVLTVISDEVDFEMSEFIINLDNIRLIDFGKEQFAEFNINDLGIAMVKLTNDGVNMNYIISSLTK